MFVSFPNSYVGILTPKVMVGRSRGLRRWLGHDGGALLSGISGFMKETPESSLTTSTVQGHSKKRPSMNQEVGAPQAPSLPVPDFELPTLQNCEKWMSIVYKPPNLWYSCYCSLNGLGVSCLLS